MFHFWVSCAISGNVCQLDFDFGPHECIVIPSSLPRSTTLEVLWLRSDCFLPVPSDCACFPTLKILHIVLNNPTNTLTKHLFSNCPSFEDLSIQASWGSDGPLTNFIISLVTSNRLYFCVKCRNLSFCCNENTILITAPNLDFLYVMALIPFNKPQWVSGIGNGQLLILDVSFTFFRVWQERNF